MAAAWKEPTPPEYTTAQWLASLNRADSKIRKDAQDEWEIKHEAEINAAENDLKRKEALNDQMVAYKNAAAQRKKKDKSIREFAMDKDNEAARKRKETLQQYLDSCAGGNAATKRGSKAKVKAKTKVKVLEQADQEDTDEEDADQEGTDEEDSGQKEVDQEDADQEDANQEDDVDSNDPENSPV